MLEVEPAVELLLTDGESMEVFTGGQLGLERQAEPGKGRLGIRRGEVHFVTGNSPCSRQNRATSPISISPPSIIESAVSRRIGAGSLRVSAAARRKAGVPRSRASA